MSRTTASIVIYNSNLSEVESLLDTLIESGSIDRIYIIDNSPLKTQSDRFKNPNITYIKNKKNIGYGGAHNVALQKVFDTSDYHFVINPDVSFSSGEIRKMIARISSKENIGLLVPKVLSNQGAIQFLCKLIPGPRNLLIRRFVLPLANFGWFGNSIYELRFTGYEREMYIPVASGCFMLFSVAALKEIGIFDERYFMYMEDVDISRRLLPKYNILYFPSACIFHRHARASYKKLSMLICHITSSIKYFNKWGWFFDSGRRCFNHALLNQLKNQCASKVFALNDPAQADLMATRVSIITATYNSANTILDTLNSIANQSFKNYEHIVVDGGSTDGTLDILHAWDKYPLKIITEKDDGIYDAMNKGVRLASGDVVGILNSDDFYADADVLYRVVENLHFYSVDSVYGDLVYVDQVNVNKLVRSWGSCAYEPGLFKSGWQPPHPTFFVKRQLYEKYGLFDLQFAISADFELMLRFFEKYQISSAYIPQILVKMRNGGESNKSLRNIYLANKNNLKAFKKNGVWVNYYTYTLRRVCPKLLNMLKHKFLGFFGG